ncbi:MAG: hypothetical protein KU38_10935 [Sulfurovum sp. FS08-3]|nr:MAG: hypothetical protein KU38_10935 [Sulfurovum sp. FS08-3]
MFKFFALLFACSLLLNAHKIKEDNTTFTLKLTKQEGVVKKIAVPNTRYRSHEENLGLIVKFNDDTKVDIASLEEKYAIKFTKKLTIGYYIFENHSMFNDYDLIENMIEHEPQLHTIRRNTPLNPKIL